MTDVTRRHFIIGTATLFSGPLAGPAFAVPTSPRDKWDAWDQQITPVGYDPATSNPWGVHPRFLPVRVEAKTGLVPSGS